MDKTTTDEVQEDVAAVQTPIPSCDQDPELNFNGENDWQSLTVDADSRAERLKQRKQRRGIHALPAAIALILVVIIWLLLRPPVIAAEIMDIHALSHWSSQCRQCAMDAQYDIMAGDVVVLSSNKPDARWSLPVFKSGKDSASPVLSWRWSTDEHAIPGNMLSMEVSFTVDEVLHTFVYSWDDSKPVDDIFVDSDGRLHWTVTGEDTPALQWVGVERSLLIDWLTTRDVAPSDDAPLQVEIRRLHWVLGQQPNVDDEYVGFVQQLSLDFSD